MLGEWIRWEPIQGLSEKYFIDCIIDSIENFSILLSDDKNEKKLRLFLKTQ
mgnify:FL=1